MSRDELADSIGQLEQELRALDRDGSGFVPQGEFQMVLLRNGGSVGQTEALIEQFGGAECESICYVDFLDSMRRLAEDTNSSVPKVNDLVAGSRSVSPLSDDNDVPTEGTARERAQESSAGMSHFWKESLGTRSSSSGASVHNKSAQARDMPYALRVSTQAQNVAAPTFSGSSANQRFAFPQNRRPASRENGHEHRTPLGSGTERMRASASLEGVRECSSSPVRRASSVERMLQQAKLRAFSDSVTPTRPEMSKARGSGEAGMTVREKSTEQRERELFRSSGGQETWIWAAKRAEAFGIPAVQSTTPGGAKAALGHADTPTTRGGRSSDVAPQHDTSRMSHGTSTAGSACRGDLISLREVFRVIDRDQDGFVTLREVWTALHRRGIDVQLLELEALADSLDLDLPEMVNTSGLCGGSNDVDVADGGDSSSRMLGTVDFCMLVSRMRSRLIERIRRSALWITTEAGCTFEFSPPPVFPTRNGADGECMATNARPQGSGGGGGVRPQGAVSASAAHDAKPTPLSVPTCTSAPQRPGEKWHLLHLNANSLSPPPSVHTSISVSHLAESGLAETPQGRNRVGAAAAISCHQLASGSSVSVSPSPEMERVVSSRGMPTKGDCLSSPSRFSAALVEKRSEGEGGKRAAVMNSSNDSQRDALVFSSRSRSPHPYDVPTARGLQHDIELSLPPSYPPATTDQGIVRPSVSMASSAASGTAQTDSASDGGATRLAAHNYTELHRNIMERQRQRMVEEDFLKRLEAEFQERYGTLMDDASVAPSEALQRPHPRNLHAKSTEKPRPMTEETVIEPVNCDVGGGDGGSGARGVQTVRSSSLVSVDSQPEGRSNGVTRLLRPTASSRAHEREVKFTYHPIQRTSSWRCGSDSNAIGVGDRGATTDNSVASLNTARMARRGRSLSSSQEPRPRGRRHQSIGEQQPTHGLAPFVASTAASRASMRSGRNEPEGSIRSMRLLSPPRHDASTISHHSYSSNSGVGPGVVRVSLLPSAPAAAGGGGGDGSKARTVMEKPSTLQTASTSVSVARARPQETRQSSGVPPRPPTRLSGVQKQKREPEQPQGDETSRSETPQFSKQISLKLYGKCSQLLSLCSNYDRTHSGFLSPKDLGRALHAVAPDLAEGEIGELVRVGLARGGGGSGGCHYVSLIGDLVVRESYVRPHKDASDDDSIETATPQPPTHTSTPSQVSYSEPPPLPPPSAAAAAPPAVPKRRGETAEMSTLEDRVRKGRLKMNRLLREELLSACSSGDYHRLRDALFAHDDIRTGYLEEKVLRKCLVKMFRSAKRVMPAWVLDRCVHLCRTPFEREILAHKDKAAAVPPPASQEEESARGRVHGIPKLLWGVLCDYRYMLEELHL